MAGNILAQLLQLAEQAGDPTVPTGYTALYAKNDHKLYQYPAGGAAVVIGPPVTSFPGLYGDGNDGVGNIVSNTSLTKDMYYSSLSVANGIILRTQGFRIFVNGQLSLTNGQISNAGNDAVGAAAGVAISAGTLGGCVAGGAGGLNGAGSAGGTRTSCCGAIGGASGAGGANAGGAGGTITPPGATLGGKVVCCNLWNALRGTIAGGSTGGTLFNGGSGGGGGGSDNGTGSGGGGGGGGGVVFIAAKIISGYGSIIASGGNGASAPGTSGNLGAGGGGGGGVVVVVTEQISNPSGALSLLAAGGNHGAAGYGGGGVGSNGSAGQVVQFVSQASVFAAGGGVKLYDNILLRQISAPSKAPSGMARIYADSAAGALKQSVNANSWANLGASTNKAGFPGLYGDGSDGAGTIAANTTLTRDMYYSSLQVNGGGVILSTANFRIFCSGTVNVDGKITTLSIAGGEHAVGMTKGTALAAGTMGKGNDGATGRSTTGTGASGSGTNYALGTSPACVGGAGGISGGGNSGGSAGAVTAIAANAGGITVARNVLNGACGQLAGTLGSTLFTGGTGGGAGGCTIALGAATSGGGGAGGGVLMICAKAITGAGSITAPGGNGGNATGASTSKAGGGGPGGGGVVVLISESIAGGLTVTSPYGSVGTGANGGSNGSVGNAGVVIKLIP